jgi:K+-transporting ATPase ATPase C chain
MLRHLRAALSLLVLLTVLTGVAYPLVVWGLSQVLFGPRANGGLVELGGAAVGSDLIGQAFSDPAYFWGRPSATVPAPYTPFDSKALTGSSGSNLGPTNPALYDTVKSRIEALRAADPLNGLPVPIDLVTASASGLDPHVSPAAAEYQVGRVARARGASEADVHALVAASVEPRVFHLLGEPRVNVLHLNLRLDRALPRTPK